MCVKIRAHRRGTVIRRNTAQQNSDHLSCCFNKERNSLKLFAATIWYDIYRESTLKLTVWPA